jgi:hypothetical protein
MSLRSLALSEPVDMRERGGAFAVRYVYVFLGALLITLGLLGPVRSLHAQTGSQAPAFQARCTDLGPVTLPTSGVIPVVVSYMKNSRHPDDDVESKTVGSIIPGTSAKVLSRDRISRGFEPNGEFHRVWGPLGIRFALVGFRTCEYTLGPSQDLDSSFRHDIPDPALKFNFDTVFLRVLGDLNTREVQADSGKVMFRGLDLYLWWRIEGNTSGYGIRPRFGKVNEESGRDDESAFGRPGAVWLDTRCVGGTDIAPSDSCAGLFSHEAGHFFGLCHCCFRPDQDRSAQECKNYLKPRYCPGLPLSTVDGPLCGGELAERLELDKRLMSATNTFKDFGVSRCEKDTALKGKEKVLRYGGNGIGSRR